MIKKKLLSLIEWSKSFNNASGITDDEAKEMAAWIEKQGEQKPAEWSEKDELKRSTLIHVVEKQQGSAIFEGLLPEELIDWLKSLKERIGE